VKKLLLLGIAVCTAAALAAAASGAQDIDEENPEFFFTRLVYAQNDLLGLFGNGTMEKPDPYLCPEFGGDDFFPPQGWGWATDTPGADCKLMGAIHRLTGQRVFPNPNYMEVLDGELFKYPYAYIVEAGQMLLSDAEAKRLREYLLRGGLIHVDDFWGLAQKQNFVDQFEKVFPDRPLEPLPLSHPLFHTFFDIAEVVQTPNQRYGCDGGETWEQSDDRAPRVYGIADDDGRLMVVVSYNTDLGDAWEYMDLPCYPEKYSHYAIRFALNTMIYAMSH
jgi:hypothetical protein